MIEKQILPKWFTGMLYTEGEIVTNIFSGEKYELTAAELSIYDFIMGCSITNSHQKEMAKGLTWFRRANPNAYMVLLD
tara:strand:+ start:1846 stop:2079 length:234 start_codon:yes stop_codon:yes gene_type:complete